jgi:hypothetical protein
VYVNGEYFGLYELREKFDVDFFVAEDTCDPASVSILSQSYWNQSILRAVEGSVDSFYADFASFMLLDPQDTAYWERADSIFDLKYYTDYIAAESWFGNADWPYNNIKIYRSDKTGFRWRFCLQDLELSLSPNSWTDASFDHITFMQNYDTTNVYIKIWHRLMTNPRYHDYFINRFADLMNSAYLEEKLVDIEEQMYQQTLPEVDAHFDRWGDPFLSGIQLLGYHVNHFTFQQELTDRSSYVRIHIRDGFGLPKMLPVILNALPEGAGYIKISTLEPEALPWTGVYFDGVPVRIEAFPNPGYQFVHWDANGLVGDTTDPLFLDTLVNSTAFFTAHFALEDTVVDGVDAKASEARFVLFPQPADEAFQLYDPRLPLGGVAHLAVYDVQGKLISESTATVTTHSLTVPTAELTNGIYFLRVSGSESNNYRFSVMR